MKMSLRALLLAGAVILFVLSVVTGPSFDFLAIGLALFAGASLVDDLGFGKRRLGR